MNEILEDKRKKRGEKRRKERGKRARVEIPERTLARGGTENDLAVAVLR